MRGITKEEAEVDIYEDLGATGSSGHHSPSASYDKSDFMDESGANDTLNPYDGEGFDREEDETHFASQHIDERSPKGHGNTPLRVQQSSYNSSSQNKNKKSPSISNEDNSYASRFNSGMDADSEQDMSKQLKLLKSKKGIVSKGSKTADQSKAAVTDIHTYNHPTKPVLKQNSKKADVGKNLSLSPSELELFGIKAGDAISSIVIPASASEPQAHSQPTQKAATRKPNSKLVGNKANASLRAQAKPVKTNAPQPPRLRHPLVPALSLSDNDDSDAATNQHSNKQGKTDKRSGAANSELALKYAGSGNHRRVSGAAPADDTMTDNGFPSSSRDADAVDTHRSLGMPSDREPLDGEDNYEADQFDDIEESALETPHEARDIAKPHFSPNEPTQQSKIAVERVSSRVDRNDEPLRAPAPEHFSRRSVPHKPITHTVLAPPNQRLHGTNFVSKDDVRSHGIDTGRRSIDEQHSARSGPGRSHHAGNAHGQGRKSTEKPGKSKKYHYYEPPPAVVATSSPENINRIQNSLPPSNKPVFAVNVSADSRNGLFSSYETEAIRQSRKETYLIANLEKKLKSLAERERVREELELRSAHERARLAEIDRRRALNVMRRQQELYIQQQQLLLLQRQQALAAQVVDINRQHDKIKTRLNGDGYQQPHSYAYASPTSDASHAYSEESRDGASPVYPSEDEHNGYHTSHVRSPGAAQVSAHSLEQKRESDRRKELKRQAEAAAAIREKIRLHEEANVRYIQEKNAVDAAASHRELLKFKEKYVTPSVSNKNSESSPRPQGHSPKRPNMSKPSNTGGRAGAIGAGRGHGVEPGISKNALGQGKYRVNGINTRIQSENAHYMDPSTIKDGDEHTMDEVNYFGDVRGNQYNHDGNVYDLGQGHSTVAIGINEDGSVVISNHSRDEIFQNSHSQSVAGMKGNNQSHSRDLGEHPLGENAISEYNSLIDYTIPEPNIDGSALGRDLGPMEESPDAVLNGDIPVRVKQGKTVGDKNYGIALLGMIGDLDGASSVQITDWGEGAEEAEIGDLRIRAIPSQL